MNDLSSTGVAMRDGVAIEVRQRQTGFLVILWATPSRVCRSERECEIQLEPEEIRELLSSILLVDRLFFVWASKADEPSWWESQDGLSNLYRREYSSFVSLVPVLGSRIREHASGAVSWAPSVEEIIEMAKHAGEVVGYDARPMVHAAKSGRIGGPVFPAPARLSY